MHKSIRMTALAALLAAAPLGASFAADRAPSADETAMISDILLSEGFTSWGQIEWNDDQWEVKNAIDQEGNRRDIALDSQFVVLNDGEDQGLVKLKVFN
jgi:hypothetical protein